MQYTTNLTTLTSVTLTIASAVTLASVYSTKADAMSINKWQRSDIDTLTNDLSTTLLSVGMSVNHTAVAQLWGEVDEQRIHIGTVLFTIGQDGKVKSKVIGKQADDNATDTEEEQAVFEIQPIRVIPQGHTVKREQYDALIMVSLAEGYEEAVKLAKSEVEKRMARAKRAVAIEMEVMYQGAVIAKVSSTGTNSIPVFDKAALDAAFEADKEFTTPKYRKDVLSLMNGQAIREYVRDGNGDEIKPTVEMGDFTQDGYYTKVKTLVVHDTAEYKNGKLIGTKRALVSRTMYEPAMALADYGDEFISVFISSSLFSELKTEEQYEELLKWVKERMSKSGYPHFIVGRKKRLIFGKKEFGATQITHDFQRVNVNRAEHLGQLVTARGLCCIGSIKTPEINISIVADGVVMMLNAKQGARLGLTEGVWQIRSVNPYSKGTIVVSSKVVAPLLNKDAIKVKPDGEWPTTIQGSDIIAISNSDSAYTMRFSHQLGYTLVDGWLDNKDSIKPWGDIPEVIAANVSVETVQKSLPTEYMRLEAYGLPHQYFVKPEGLESVLVKAARPQFASLTMFVALPIERLDRNYYDKVGVYMPDTLSEEEEGRYWVRIPALAVNGAIQDLHTTDINGVRILADKPSDMLNVTVAAIHEATEVKNAEGETVMVFPDDVENGGDGRSRIIWEMMQAMGADSDGDRTGRTFKSMDTMLEGAGLTTPRDVPFFKTKLSYKGIDTWEQKDRERLWVVSTPKLANVGMGDIQTRKCVDLIYSGYMKRSTWEKQRRVGSEIVQSGVSAPKYATILKEKAPLTSMQINTLMKENNVGDGSKFGGLLYEPANKKITEALSEFFPEDADKKDVIVTYASVNWPGGFSSFHDRLAIFDETMGDNWVTAVKQAFKMELRRMVTYGLTGEAAQNALTKFTKLYKAGNARNMVRKYVAAYIQAHPQNQHIWAWLLDPEFIRVQDNDRRPDGLALTAPQLDMDNTGRILEVMGMPFDEERLKEKQAKRDEAAAKRADK